MHAAHWKKLLLIQTQPTPSTPQLAPSTRKLQSNCVRLQPLQVGILTSEELESVVRKEFNPVRVQFAGNEPVWTKDVLNLGVSPQVSVF